MRRGFPVLAGAGAGLTAALVSVPTAAALAGVALLGWARAAGGSWERGRQWWVQAIAVVLATPFVAALEPRTLVLAGWWIGIAAFGLYRPREAILALIVLIPFHHLGFHSLYHRWAVDLAGFTSWKEILVVAVALRAWFDGGLGTWWTNGPMGREAIRAIVALAVLAFLRSAWEVAWGESSAGVVSRGLAVDLGPLAVLFAAGSLGGDRGWGQRVARTVTGLAACAAVFGFVQLVLVGPGWYGWVGYLGERSFQVPGTDRYRLTSVFLDPVAAGLFLAAGAAIAFGRVVEGERGRMRPWLGALVGLGAVLSFTRGAWLALAGGVASVTISAGPAARRRILAGLAVIGVLALPASPWIVSRIAGTVGLRDDSSRLHLEAWARGIETLVQHPFGLGPGRAGELSLRLLGDQGLRVESTYLQVAVHYGWPGFLLFGMLVATIGTGLSARAAHDPSAVGAKAAWTALAIAGLFTPMAFFDRAVAYPVCAVVGAVLASAGRGR